MRLAFHNEFAHDYEVQQLDEVFGLEYDVKHFPSWGYASESSVNVLIKPPGKEPWVAIFQAQQHSNWTGLSALYSCPNSSQLCVVANGQAYIIDVYSRTAIELPDISADWVLRVDASLEAGVLVFSGDPWLWAWGVGGLLWDTAVDGDGLAIVAVTARSVHVRWSWGGDGNPFVSKFDLETGHCEPDKEMAKIKIFSKDECLEPAAKWRVDPDRVLVWHLFSIFYLDLVPAEQDIERMLEVLVSSPFSVEELSHAAYYEVYPVCVAKLSPKEISEWSYFEPDLLVPKCKELMKKRRFRSTGRQDEMADLPWRAALEHGGVLSFLNRIAERRSKIAAFGRKKS